MITIQQIIKCNPCEQYTEKYLHELFAGRDFITAPDVINSSIPSPDKVWALLSCGFFPGRELRLIACDISEAVLYLFDAEHPGDCRPRNAIIATRRFEKGEITREELEKARAAAGKAASWAAAGKAKRVAAWATLWATGKAAAREAAGAEAALENDAWMADAAAAEAVAENNAWATATAAGQAAAWAATRTAAAGAGRAAWTGKTAWDAAKETAWDAQIQIIEKYI